MLNSFWRNAYSSSRQVLILSSFLTVASSSSRTLIPDLGHCQPKKVRSFFLKSKCFLEKENFTYSRHYPFWYNVNISMTHPSPLLREISGNFQKFLEENRDVWMLKVFIKAWFVFSRHLVSTVLYCLER